MAGTRSKLGRPARLSRERIVSAALDGDLATLTMRELAGRLEVSHSSLYRWVADRDELFDLISEVMVERILPGEAPTPGTWRAWLAALAWAMHDEFLAVPGYATHLAHPHRHNPKSFDLLRGQIVDAFRAGGADDRMAEQSWYIFALGIINWLGAQQPDMGAVEPRFDLYLDVLLRGLPTRLPAQYTEPDKIAPGRPSQAAET